MAEPHTPPHTPQNPTYTTTTNTPPYTTNTTTTHIRETRSTNWFAYLLGGAVIAVGIGALVLTGNDDATTTAPAASGNNVTIEAPAASTPAADPVAPAPADPIAPAPADPIAPAPADPVAPAPADPAAPAPEAGTTPPTGN